MLRRLLNRRDALRLGASAAAAATAATVRPAPAWAAPAGLFELALDDDLARASAAVVGWRTLAPRRAPRRFDLLGLRWDSGELAVALRTRRPDGSWTAWTPLPSAGDHAPDGTPLTRGTEPAWTGPAKVFQLRLCGRASGLRARFVRSGPAARTARRLARRGRMGGARVRASQAGPPEIVPREAWGAALVPPRAPAAYGSVQLAFVHHTVTLNDYGPDESAAIVLAIARYHRNSNGWNDVGYNFLVDRYGQVFEGRAGGIDQPVIGAQAQGFNAVSTGIACLGDFSAITQSPEALDALARLIGWKLSLHGVPVEGAVTVPSGGGESSRFPAGSSVTFERIAGHRDANRTSCPGDALYAQLPDLRERAAGYASRPTVTAALSLRSAAPLLRGDAPLTVSGVLRFADGSSPSGASLAVEFQGAGEPGWSRVATAVAGADGAWAAASVVPRTGRLRAVFGGDATRPRLESPPVPVTVVPRLTIALGAPRTVTASPVSVSGTVSPSAPRVTCILERQIGRRWVLVQRKRVVVRGGRYGTLVRPRRAGLYRVSVLTPGAVVRRRLRASDRGAGATGGVPPR